MPHSKEMCSCHSGAPVAASIARSVAAADRDKHVVRRRKLEM